MMKSLANFIERIFRFFASIQLAIFVLISMAIMSAIGTIVEARYDASYAQKTIYHSPLMYFILALLCVNLFNVMVDRFPWKKRHIGFLFAHIGIILLILGALVTRLFGVDGSIAFDIGQKNRHVVLPDTELSVHASFLDGGFKSLFSTQQDFLLKPPKKGPIAIPLGKKDLIVKDYYPFSIRSEKVVPTESKQDGPAVRIQLQNPNVNMTRWLVKPKGIANESIDLGPAKIILANSEKSYSYNGGNEIVLVPSDREEIKYFIYTQSQNGLTGRGELKVADTVQTGWMGLTLRLLKFHAHAERKFEYLPKERPTPLTVPAVQIEFDSKEYWIGLNTNLRLFSELTMYVVSYRNRLIDLGFDINLDKFNVGRYQGTNRAKTYESVVTIDEIGTHTISMNEPLKHSGYTFYQASFQEDATGQATTSILSVNKDPGRAIKYLGSLLIVLGIVFMFYFKQKFMGIGKSKNES